MSDQPDPPTGSEVPASGLPGQPDTGAPPRDLTPEELANLNPALEPGTSSGMPAAGADEPGAPTDSPTLQPFDSVVDAVLPSDAVPSGGAVAVLTSGGDGQPATAVVTAGTSGDPDSSDSGSRTTVTAAVGQGGALAAGFQLSENVGLSSAAYQRAAALPADRALVKLLVPESRTLDLWKSIDGLEREVEGLHRGSQDLVAEMIDRLSTARNLLMHSRASYEDAEREVAIVRHRLLRVQQSAFLEQPQTIVGYLVLMLILLGAGFALTSRILTGLGNPVLIAGINATTLVNTLLWGGIGGLSAAFFALQRHVLDFDQQHARWFYLSPVIGLFIGPLIALVAEIGLPALFVLAGGQTANMTVAPALLYLLAWAVGFQQNLLLRLINTVFQSIFPDKNAAG